MQINELFNARDAQGRNWLDFQNYMTAVLTQFDQANDEILAAVRAGGAIDPAVVADRLAGPLAERVVTALGDRAGVTKADVAAAVREVFADAGA